MSLKLIYRVGYLIQLQKQIQIQTIRNFSLTNALQGGKKRRRRNAPTVQMFERLPEYYKVKKLFRPHPWDRRYSPRAEEVGPDMLYGHKELVELLPEKVHPPTSVRHALTGEEIHVPEMVPELIVPDLTDFMLKPYVSYKVKEIEQKPLTPKKLFEAVYAQQVADDYNERKIRIEGNKIVLKDGKTLILKKSPEDKRLEKEDNFPTSGDLTV